MKKVLCILLITAFKLYSADIVMIENSDDNSDLTQTDPVLDLPRDGMIQCGSVAVTNSFVGLQKNGYPDLMRDNENELENYKLIISELSDYTRVLERGYVSTSALIHGIDMYVKASGYEYKALNSYYLNYSLALLQNAIQRNSSVFVVMRWFEPNGENRLKNAWTGHWFTLIGYEHSDDRIYLYANDPSPYASKVSPKRYQIKKIESDLIDASGSNYKGYYELVDFYKRDPAERAIIVGAVELIMQEPVR